MTTVPPARPVPACALELIRSFEGLHDGDKRTPILLEPQACPAGIYTVGWGYALFDAGRPVRDAARAMAIWRARWPEGFTRETAEVLLRKVGQDVCDRALRLLAGAAVNDHELGAMVSLAYNIGVGEPGGAADFADSSVLRLFRAGNQAGAADAFRLWKYVDRQVVPGLVRRRDAERALFLTPPELQSSAMKAA